MARPLRIEYPGAFYHVTSRGDRQESIFEDDEDREAFLAVLARTCSRLEWLCHAFCLMDNHYHLLLETPQPNLAQGMRQLNGVYTQRFNVRHAKTGHVFQGRYKAIVVERDSHAVEACRYIVLNPVRAGAACSATAWPWSSYRATAGLRSCPDWLRREWLLAQFGKAEKAAQCAYRAFIREGRDAHEAFWRCASGGVVLGSEAFAARILPLAGPRREASEVPKKQRLMARPALADILAPAESRSRSRRNKAIAKAFLAHGYRMKEIAVSLGVHYATVSRAIDSEEKRMSFCKT